MQEGLLAKYDWIRVIIKRFISEAIISLINPRCQIESKARLLSEKAPPTVSCPLNPSLIFSDKRKS